MKLSERINQIGEILRDENIDSIHGEELTWVAVKVEAIESERDESKALLEKQINISRNLLTAGQKALSKCESERDHYKAKSIATKHWLDQTREASSND